MLGVPLEDISSIEQYLVALVEGLSQQVEKLPMLDEAVVNLLEYIRPAIAGRRAGERVDDLTIPLTFAGQDPAFNEDPRTFEPDRKSCKHIAFGIGPHFCPGKFLALALLEEALPIVVRRMPRPRVEGELEYIGPFGAWGVRSLPIEFDVVASG